MRLVGGILLALFGFCWAAFFSAGAAMTTETGIWNSTTWIVMAIAALGAIPFLGGIYLCVRSLVDWSSQPKRQIPTGEHDG